MISQLRAAHAADSATASGVDVITGGMGDMSKLGIYESFRVSKRRGCLERRKNRAVPRVNVFKTVHSMHLQRKLFLNLSSKTVLDAACMYVDTLQDMPAAVSLKRACNADVWCCTDS